MSNAASPLMATVVLRSYNRLDECCEAIEVCLTQDYTDFEVLVIEQSTNATPQQKARLTKLAADSRVRVVYAEPLGGPGSRNFACDYALGDVIIMLDDDDLPAGPTWLSAFMKNFADPRCLAVTGRHIFEGGKEPPYANMDKARARVLSYNWLMWQHCFTQVDVRSEAIENIHGTNSAIRRQTLERFGLWDTCTKIEDENSLCYRILAGKDDHEYMVFDPDAAIIRRLDIGGGLDKRQMSVFGYGGRIFDFLHNIVGHYHTGRFALCYPAYVWLLFWVTAEWVRDESSAHHGKPLKTYATITGLFFSLPIVWSYWLSRYWLRRIRDGKPMRAGKLGPRTKSSQQQAA